VKVPVPRPGVRTLPLLESDPPGVVTYLTSVGGDTTYWGAPGVRPSTGYPVYPDGWIEVFLRRGDEVAYEGVNARGVVVATIEIDRQGRETRTLLNPDITALDIDGARLCG